MAIISSRINGDKSYKVLITDSATHTPATEDKYYVKMDATSSTGFSGVYDFNDTANIGLYFTGWLVSSVVEDTKTYGYIRMALPPRLLVTITADQDDATIEATTATGL